MQSFMITLLVSSLTMSALALFYMAVMPLLAKRYSCKLLYYTWLVIVIGLIIPFRPQFNNAIFKVDVPGETTAYIIQLENRMPAAVQSEPSNSENTAHSPALPIISFWQVATVIWLAGVIFFFAYHVIKHYRFIKMVERWSEYISDEQVLTQLQSIKSMMGITKQLSLYKCSSIGSPMMIGFINPRILLPKTDLTQNELRFILHHELVHYKQKDLWYKCLVLTATAIHWFNPIVYITAKAIDMLCEMSCDAEVVHNKDTDTRQHYSETIIGVVKYQSKMKTALSTNFYGGKEGMKKRIISIMDTSSKKTGFAIICGMLIVTVGTGFAFTANTSANTPTIHSGSTMIANSNQEFDPSYKYAKYKEYGLIYNKGTGYLYFNGELVCYFEDWYPVGENGKAGVDYFNENGTIDVHGVRDLSKIVHNADGSYDPSGKLIGVEPYSQVEFDTRDIELLKNPPQSQAVTIVSDSDNADNASYYGSNTNFILSDDSREAFKIYAEFGLTYDEDNVFRYQGKTVRWFHDLGGALAFTRIVENDYDKSVDLSAIRNMDGKLTGLSLASKVEFDQRTKRIEQSQKEQEEFYKNNPSITLASDYAGNNAQTSVSYEAGLSNGSVQLSTGANAIATSATSYNSDYVDTSLNDYINYGVSYDKLNKSWTFNNKTIHFLFDPGHQIYVNYLDDNTDVNFAKKVEESKGTFIKVIRKSDASINKIVEMTTDEAVKTINDIFN